MVSLASKLNGMPLELAQLIFLQIKQINPINCTFLSYLEQMNPNGNPQYNNQYNQGNYGNNQPYGGAQYGGQGASVPAPANNTYGYQNPNQPNQYPITPNKPYQQGPGYDNYGQGGYGYNNQSQESNCSCAECCSWCMSITYCCRQIQRCLK